VRNLFLKKKIKALDDEEKEAPVTALAGDEATKLTTRRKKLVDDMDQVKNDKNMTSDRKKTAIAKLIEDYNHDVQPLLAEPIDFNKKLRQLEKELATEEADALEKQGLYTILRTFWFSAWGFTPVTQRKYFVSPDNSELFAAEKFDAWELNLQLNFLWDYKRGGTVYLAPGYKVFQNNSAMADLMTAVDYEQYSQFPGSNSMNLAKLESNKAFIGTYKRFVTNNFNVQAVYMAPFKGFINAGVSVKIEQNFGDYEAMNLKFGIPLKIDGNEKPINIEPQLKLNNVNNYADVEDYSVKPTFGVNVGLPFGTLFK
jgi:hypothetical protein